jgi:hypothetical protein
MTEEERCRVLNAPAVLVGRQAETHRLSEIERERPELIVDLDRIDATARARPCSI